MRVKFIKEFVSASVGNVWLGREIELPDDAAAMWVKNGYAEFVKEEAQKNGDSDINRIEEPSADRPKRRGRPSK